MKFQVVCIDDSRKPSEVPASSWIERQEIYTVTMVSRMAKQGMILGFKLAEVSMPEGCKYQHYMADRFRPATEEDFEAIEAVKKLMEESLELELLEL